MIQSEREKIERIREHAERKIWVTFRREGIHCYPAAATDPKLNTAGEYDVAFLASPHRHIFHFRVWIDVWHNDRDIEFIQFKRWLESLYSGNNSVLELDFKSCEMIADFAVNPATLILQCLRQVPMIYGNNGFQPICNTFINNVVVKCNA